MSRDNASWIASLREDGADRERALTELRDALLRGLRRSFRARSDVDEAFLEDTVQDALLRILDRIGQFAGRSQFTTWATSIAIRVAMSELRRSRWRDVSLDEIVEDAGFEPGFPADESSDPELGAERQAILTTLREAIVADLTEKQRTALLAELKGMPQDEIGRQMRSNRNAVYKLTHDARKRLKQSLLHAGYQTTDVRTAFPS